MPRFFSKDQDDNNNDPDLIKTYLSWKAPARPFRKKDRSYYTTIAIIVILLILIALLLREILLIGVLLAIAFVAYVLGFIPPEDVEYKISAQGITIGDHFYLWADLNSFWFAEKEGQKVLHVLTYLRFPGELMLVLGNQNEEEIKKIVAKYLPYHEIAPKSMIDKWSESLQKHFPMENPHK
ncbi:MAG: hypothetical protein Q7R97_05225 [Candidatus Daviesbacteria bacterium]|nr:hypothetical protein [Candidatus Daviesbacteria bacterium]